MSNGAGFSDKIQHLKHTTSFPLDELALSDFNTLKGEIEKAALHSIDENVPFVVECDASDVAISATLNQAGRPVVSCRVHCMAVSFITLQ